MAEASGDGGARGDLDAPNKYQIGVQADALPVWTIDEIAAYLISGEGTGDTRRWDVTQGGTITVDLADLTVGGQYLAREALALWSDVIGVTFVEVTAGAQIDIDDDQPGAFMSGVWANGLFQSAVVNVSLQPSADVTIEDPLFRVYMHEIGHALGLGHAGPYAAIPGPLDYSTHAIYANDGGPTTIMSYFSAENSLYFADQGFSPVLPGTPMIADIAAMQLLYGDTATTRSGDTTYGFNSNAGRDVFDANLHPSLRYTVVDNGGLDTLDYSGFSADQLIHLTEGAYSNVGGHVGLVVVAIGTAIENAVGGSGNDQLLGNSANNALSGGGGNDVLSGGLGSDALSGGAGNDVFRGTAAELSGDTIADFAMGDRIVISDATLAGFTQSLTGSTLTYTGGSLTFGSALAGAIVASAAAEGGVQLTLNDTPPLPPVTRARLILTEAGQDVLIGGNVAVFGTTSGGEVIEVVSGDITFDGSFNAGGDTVVLAGAAGDYSATLSGSFVTISDGDTSVAIPVGLAGMMVDFSDVDLELRVESGQVMLGDDMIPNGTLALENLAFA